MRRTGQRKGDVLLSSRALQQWLETIKSWAAVWTVKPLGQKDVEGKERDARRQGLVIDIRPHTSVNPLFAASLHISIYQHQRGDERVVVWGMEKWLILIRGLIEGSTRVKWLMMMSPEQLPRTASAMRGKGRGGEETREERMLIVTAWGRCEMCPLSSICPPTPPSPRGKERCTGNAVFHRRNLSSS